MHQKNIFGASKINFYRIEIIGIVSRRRINGVKCIQINCPKTKEVKRHNLSASVEKLPDALKYLHSHHDAVEDSHASIELLN